MHGHAVHFLERLERAEDSEAEFAMELYRKPNMVRMMLLMISPPPEVKRIAISIAPEDEGPFIVVTRHGHFVTCLGRGMRIGESFVVKHERLQSYLHKIKMLQERKSYLNNSRPQKKSGRRTPQAAWIRAFQSDRACREDIWGVSAHQPTLKRNLLTDLALDLPALLKLEKALFQTRKIPKSHESAARVYWKNVHALANETTVISMFGPHGLEDLLGREELLLPLVSIFRFGPLSCAARSLFAVGKLGRYAVPLCRRCLTEAAEPTTWLFGLLGLAVIGLRHQKLRFQLHRLISKSLRENVEDASQKAHAYQAALGEAFFGTLTRAMEDDETLSANTLAVHRRYIFEHMTASGRSFGGSGIVREKDVPENDVFASAVNAMLDVRSSLEAVIELTSLLPRLARAEAEDFYLPRQTARLVKPKWSLADFNDMLGKAKRWYVHRTTPKQVPIIGRNEPCYCGSGLKYKKCCLQKEVPDPSV